MRIRPRRALQGVHPRPLEPPNRQERRGVTHRAVERQDRCPRLPVDLERRRVEGQQGLDATGEPEGAIELTREQVDEPERPGVQDHPVAEVGEAGCLGLDGRGLPVAVRRGGSITERPGANLVRRSGTATGQPRPAAGRPWRSWTVTSPGTACAESGQPLWPDAHRAHRTRTGARRSRRSSDPCRDGPLSGQADRTRRARPVRPARGLSPCP